MESPTIAAESIAPLPDPALLHCCAQCGYSLDGMPLVHRCPECGEPFDRRWIPINERTAPELRRRHSRQWRWAVAAAAGAFLLWRRGFGAFEQALIAILIVGCGFERWASGRKRPRPIMMFMGPAGIRIEERDAAGVCASPKIISWPDVISVESSWYGSDIVIRTRAGYVYVPWCDLFGSISAKEAGSRSAQYINEYRRQINRLSKPKDETTNGE